MGSLEEYFEWAAEQGVRWPKVKYPNTFPPGYDGCMAVEDIEAGEALVTVPDRLIFSFARAINSELQGVFETETEVFNPTSGIYQDLILTTFLLFEKFKKEESFWYFFLWNQPEFPEVLQDWNENELLELQDEDLVKDTYTRANFDEEIFRIWKEALENYPEVIKREMLEKEEFRWAWKLLTTRAFGKFLPTTSLVPIADYFNHSNTLSYYFYSFEEQTPNSSQRYTNFEEFEDHDDTWLDDCPHILLHCEKVVILHEKATGLELDYLKQVARNLDAEEFYKLVKHRKTEKVPKAVEDEGKVFRIVAGEDYKVGEEVYMSYGRYSNKQLLCYYGFAMEENEYNYVRLKVRFTDFSEDPRVLKAVEDLEYGGFLIFRLKSHCLNHNLLRLIRSLVWNEEYSESACFSAQDCKLEKVVIAEYIKAVGRKLEEYPTSLETDLSLYEGDVSKSLSFALLYRIGNKKILKTQIEAAMNIQSLLEILNTDEFFEVIENLSSNIKTIIQDYLNTF